MSQCSFSKRWIPKLGFVDEEGHPVAESVFSWAWLDHLLLHCEIRWSSSLSSCSLRFMFCNRDLCRSLFRSLICSTSSVFKCCRLCCWYKQFLSLDCSTDKFIRRERKMNDDLDVSSINTFCVSGRYKGIYKFPLIKLYFKICENKEDKLISWSIFWVKSKNYSPRCN